MELRYKTKIEFFKTINLLVPSILTFIFGLLLFLKTNHESKGLNVFASIFIIFCPIQIIRIVKRFELYDQFLIISRPLSMTSKTNTVLKISEIREVIFRNISGRFGGPVVIVDSSVLLETYRINFSRIDIDEFEKELNRLGVKTIRDRI